MANAGGVTVSCFEWVQNNQGLYWHAEEVAEKLQKSMRHSFEVVYEMAKEHGVDMRLAAYMTGVLRLAEAVKFRGWYNIFKEQEP